MAARSKSQKISKGAKRQRTSTSANGSSTTGPDGRSGKRRRVAAKGALVLGNPRQPVIEEEEVVSCELVDFGLTNSNIKQQLRLLGAYPFIIDPDVRRNAMDAVRRAFATNIIDVQLEAAKLVGRFQLVNLAVFKQLASDQVQRHLGFERQESISDANKRKAMESMTDEQLEALEALSKNMGGMIEVGDESA